MSQSHLQDLLRQQFHSLLAVIPNPNPNPNPNLNPNPDPTACHCLTSRTCSASSFTVCLGMPPGPIPIRLPSSRTRRNGDPVKAPKR